MPNTLYEVVESLTEDANLLDEHLEHAQATLARAPMRTDVAIEEMAADAAGVLDVDGQFCAELKPDRALLERMLSVWLSRLVRPQGDRSPWVETVLLGLYLSAIGARPASFMAMVSVLGSRFVEACRELPESDRLDVSAAFSQILSFAGIKLAACFDAMTLRALARVGMAEGLARRLPYLAMRALVAAPRARRDTRGEDEVRGWMYDVIHALEDARERTRRGTAELMRNAANPAGGDVRGQDQEEFATQEDVNDALREATARQLVKLSGGAIEERSISDELPHALRRLLSGSDDLPFPKGSPSGGSGSN